MAKKYFWDIDEIVDIFDGEGEDASPVGTKTLTHRIELVCSKISGKAIITIDGDSFNISVRPFSLAGTQQMFRLGNMAANVCFSKKGAPVITVDGEALIGKRK